MTEGFILCGVILLMCVLSSKLLYGVGVPALLIFLGFGMLFGSDGVVGIPFDNFTLAQQICTVCLIFIMFYGGFGTNWKMARPILAPSILLSTLGVVITAALTGLFCYFVLKMTMFEGFLIGSVVASTDAASVFAILRSRNLNLKGGLSSLLEIESGSNDPFAYLLTVIVLTFVSPSGSGPIWLLLLRQIAFGLLVGFLLSKAACFLLHKITIETEGLYPIFIIAVALLSYSLSESIGGNGYLSVYVAGILIGNSKIMHKKSLVRFFDGVSWLMQILLFFILGLLSFPSHLPAVAVTGISISLFLLFIARPAAVFGILSWFKVPIKQQLLVSWVGLRGAASIVFAIYAVSNGAAVQNDIFHIVFFIALFSVTLQGTLIPTISKRLGLVNTESSVMKTFNDYEGEINTKLMEIMITEDNIWANQSIVNAEIPDEILVVMIKRGKEVLIPNGSTVIHPGDTLVLSSNDFESFDF